MKVRIDSIYKFGSPYLDEIQDEYVWGILDLPPVIPRDDDQFYVWRENDRLDLLAYEYLGDPRHFPLIMHYNNIPDAMDMDDFAGTTLRIPSRETLEKVYLHV